MSKSPRSETETRPFISRVTLIVMDHIVFAEGHPAHLDNIATRLGISRQAALAYAIAEQITEEFLLTENLE